MTTETAILIRYPIWVEIVCSGDRGKAALEAAYLRVPWDTALGYHFGYALEQVPAISEVLAGVGVVVQDRGLRMLLCCRCWQRQDACTCQVEPRVSDST